MTIIRDIIDRGREPEEDRPIPAAPGVVDVSTVQGEGTDEVVNTLPTSVTAPSTLGNIPESTAQALVQTEQPAQMPHATLSYPSIPDTLIIGEGIDSVSQAVRADLDAMQRDSSGGLVSDMYAVGELQRVLGSQYNSYIEQDLPSNRIVERNLKPAPSAITDYLNQQKQEKLREATVPSSQRGFSGVTRTLADGNPLSSTSHASITDAMEVDRQGAPTSITVEPVYEVTPFDRFMSRTLDTVGLGVPVLGAFSRPLRRALGLPMSAEDIRDARENVSAIGTLTRVSAENLGENLSERAGEVGPFGLLTDAYFGVTRPLAEAFTGPITPTNRHTYPEFVQDRVPNTNLTPNANTEVDENAIVREAVERNQTTGNFFQRLERASADTETVNFMRGEYGEYGTGALAGTFYLLSLPQGVMMATAYTVSDKWYYPEDVDRPNRFAQVFVEGRDFSFSENYTEDKYLSLVGNPVFNRLPSSFRPTRAGQLAIGFLGDLVIGGKADDVIFGGARKAARGVLSIGKSRRTLRPAQRALDDVIQRSADTVLRKPSVPGDDISRLNFQIDNALRNAPVEDNAKVLVPELDDALKRFGVDDARPYRLQTAIDDLADERQLSLPFINTRAQGTVVRRGLRVAGAGDVLEETENLVRLRSLEERAVELQKLVDTAPQRAREVVAPPEQIAEQLTLEHHRAALANTLDEQQAIARRLSLPEAEVLAGRINHRAEVAGIIRVENNGFIFQSEPNLTYDTLLPTIPLRQVQPRNVGTVEDFLLRYRYAPDSVDELDINLVRRTDETLENLGRVWNVENGTFRLPETPTEELGNIYRAKALEEEYPTLLARFGKPVSNRIESPMMRIDFSSQFDTDELVSAIPAVRPQLLLPPVQDGTAIRKQVDRLQRRAVKFSDQIRDSLVRNDLSRAVKVRDRLEETTNSLFHLYADNPEITTQLALRRLPDSVRPVGAASRALGDRYILAQERFFYETGVLKKLRKDLFSVRDLLEEQRRVVSESPLLERIPILNEVATKRSQGLTNRFATAEVANPGPDIRVPQLVDLIGDQPTSFNKVKNFEEFRGLTDEQLRRAINNDGRVFVDSTGNIRAVGDTDFGPDISISGVVHYHGTKATTLDVAATSASNEFGPGLYVSTDKNLARRFARATPAKDLLDTTTLTPRFTNQGRIFPIELVDDFNTVDIRNLTEQQVENLRTIFRTTLEDRADFIVSRFNSWSKRHDPHEWWHYVRSQFMRENGGDVLEYVGFAEEVRDKLRLLGIDGIKDGDTIAILNRGKTQVFEPFEDAHSTGGIGEGLLNRYAADFDLHNRMKSPTTQAILEQDRLAIDEFAHAQLKKATREQQIITTRTVREYNRMTDDLDGAVVRDKRRQLQIDRQETVRDTINTHNRTNREVSDIPKEC